MYTCGVGVKLGLCVKQKESLLSFSKRGGELSVFTDLNLVQSKPIRGVNAWAGNAY